MVDIEDVGWPELPEPIDPLKNKDQEHERIFLQAVLMDSRDILMRGLEYKLRNTYCRVRNPGGKALPFLKSTKTRKSFQVFIKESEAEVGWVEGINTNQSPLSFSYVCQELGYDENGVRQYIKDSLKTMRQDYFRIIALTGKEPPKGWWAANIAKQPYLGCNRNRAIIFAQQRDYRQERIRQKQIRAAAI